MSGRARWLYHVVRQEDAPRPDAATYAPASLAREGFVHASYAPLVRESAELYFSKDAKLVVLRIDPRKLACETREVATPRGGMPHIFGAIPTGAIVDVVPLADFDASLDDI